MDRNINFGKKLRKFIKFLEGLCLIVCTLILKCILTELLLFAHAYNLTNVRFRFEAFKLKEILLLTLPAHVFTYCFRVYISTRPQQRRSPNVVNMKPRGRTPTCTCVHGRGRSSLSVTACVSLSSPPPLFPQPTQAHLQLDNCHAHPVWKDIDSLS